MNAAYKKAQVQRTVVYASERSPAKATEDNLTFVKEVLTEISHLNRAHEPINERTVEIEV